MGLARSRPKPQVLFPKSRCKHSFTRMELQRNSEMLLYTFHWNRWGFVPCISLFVHITFYKWGKKVIGKATLLEILTILSPSEPFQELFTLAFLAVKFSGGQSLYQNLRQIHFVQVMDFIWNWCTILRWILSTPLTADNTIDPQPTEELLLVSIFPSPHSFHLVILLEDNSIWAFYVFSKVGEYLMQFTFGIYLQWLAKH